MMPRFCIASRCGAGLGPENSILALKRSLAATVHAVNVDVRLADGELFVLRSERLEECTNGYGFVDEQPISYLRSLHVGGGSPIATLAHVIETVNHACPVLIDIRTQETAEAVVDMLHFHIREKGWHYDDFVVASPLYDELRSVKYFDHHITTSMIVSGIPLFLQQCARALDASSIRFEKGYVTPEVVESCQMSGFQVHAGVVDIEEEMERMHACGVDAILTNYPDRLLRWASHRRSRECTAPR